MNDYIPNLRGRDIVMVSDFISDSYDEFDKKEEENLLKLIKKDLSVHKIKFHFVEVKNKKDLHKQISKFDKDKVVIFNWCEAFDEKPNTEYLATKYFDKYGWIYTGAKTQCLKVSENRNKVYKILKRDKVSVPRQYKLTSNAIKFPIIVKAAKEHGSFGITENSIIERKTQLEVALTEIKSNKFIGEQFIDGPEYTISMWGPRKHPEILPVFEIKFESNSMQRFKIINYHSKWDRSHPDYLGVHSAKAVKIDKRLKNAIYKNAKRAYKALNCTGYARLEFRTDKNIPYLTDFNSNPTFRLESTFIRSAQEGGYSPGNIVAKLCEFALNE